MIGCILLNFYIKPQPMFVDVAQVNVVSYWISTSNHNLKVTKTRLRIVVSYWISTSNHNDRLPILDVQYVVSYWISTSNHNLARLLLSAHKLYLIEFLHQTTTRWPSERIETPLYLIEFLHQTTTPDWFIIICELLYLIEFLHQTTTRERFAGCCW